MSGSVEATSLPWVSVVWVQVWPEASVVVMFAAAPEAVVPRV